LSLQARIDRAQGRLLEAMINTSRWGAALEAVSEACGARAGQLIALDAEHNPTSHWVSGTPEDFPSQWLRYGFADPRVNPRFGAGLTAPLMTPIADQDYANVDLRKRSPIYRDIFDPNDLPFNCQAVLMRDKQAFVRASVTRSLKQGPLDNDAFRAFAALLPYLQAAIRVQANLALNERNAVLRTLDALTAVVFCLDDLGRVIGMSKPAAVMAERGDVVMVSAKHLRLPEEIDQKRLAPMVTTALASATRRFPVALEPLCLSSRALVIEVHPLPREHLCIAGSPALLLLIRPAKKAERIQALRGVYRLTPAEAEVANAVADGSTLQEIAKLRSASLTTVRSQLQAVFAKLGVQRQSDLIRKLSSSHND
jgi:DNA-binding CsgD family transcriptional regulator